MTTYKWRPPAPPAELLGLSIWPEWNYAIAQLGKRIENRGEAIARRAKNLRGRYIALHGSQNLGGIPHRSDGTFTPAHVDAVQIMLETARDAGARPPFSITIRELLDKGRGITQIARLLDVLPPSDTRQGWHMLDCWGLEFEDPIVLETPVPCPGALGFWSVPRPVIEKLVRQLPRQAGELRGYLEALVPHGV